MDRRKVLKNMGLSLGYVVATPTLISIVQSCKSEKTIEWIPDYFTKEEGNIVLNMVDLILPKTDTPSASEVNVHIFIDKFINEVVEKEQLDLLKLGTNKFISKALKNAEKDKEADLTPKDIDAILATTLKISKEQAQNNKKKLNKYFMSLKAENTMLLSDELAIYAFVNDIRNLTIWGYKTSEYVAEEILAYDSIPGKYVPCGDLNELTDGKAWALN